MKKSNNIDSDLNPGELVRFSRHLSLSQIGIQGQKELKAASILCVGCGGLGSPLLLYLAAAGIGNIGIVDFDVVDESNLQRQIIHGTSWIGKLKTLSARARINEINPYCKVDLYETGKQAQDEVRLATPLKTGTKTSVMVDSNLMRI